MTREQAVERLTAVLLTLRDGPEWLAPHHLSDATIPTGIAEETVANWRAFADNLLDELAVQRRGHSPSRRT